jgi:16S rRNA (cytidine1402-2'-O)-methyltransferase
MTAGRIFLLPTLLAGVEAASVLPERTLATARAIEHFVVENAKPARAFLKSAGHPGPLQSLAIVELGEAPTPAQCRELLAPARGGHDLGLLSDAGCPGIADPGALLVAAAHREGMIVIPLVGPSSLLLALMASGMNGQGFAFHGYLPVKTEPRTEALRRLEAQSLSSGHAQMFIETPYRNEAMLAAIVATCRPQTHLCVAVDLTAPTESVETRSLRDWRGRDSARYARRPAVFILQAR